MLGKKLRSPSFILLFIMNFIFIDDHLTKFQSGLEDEESLANLIRFYSQPVALNKV